MQKSPTRPGIAVALFATASMLAGCQSYESKPLDLTSHRDSWLARAPGDEPVQQFAARLADAGEPAVFDLDDGLSLAEAEVVALVFNAELRIARLRAGVAAATAAHAGLWQNPQFGMDFLSLTDGASDPLLVTPGLSFTIPISGCPNSRATPKPRMSASVTSKPTKTARRGATGTTTGNRMISREVADQPPGGIIHVQDRITAPDHQHRQAQRFLRRARCRATWLLRRYAERRLRRTTGAGERGQADQTSSARHRAG